MRLEEKSVILIGACLFLWGGVVFPMEKSPDKMTGLGQFLPREVDGWQASGQDETYDPETIFDYIDGAGEVYRAYHFQKLHVRRFEKEGNAALIVDFFDMGRAADAFGVFTHDLEGENLDIGQAATYKGGLLSFWKGRYFVSVYAENETAETRDAVVKLGRNIASAIGEEGKRPGLLDLLPSGFPHEGARYFHDHLVLNYHFFVASENILLLGHDTEAVLAASGQGESRAHLLIIRYPGADRAMQAHKSFIRAYMPDARRPEFVQTEDATWTGIKITNEVIMIVFHAPSEDLAVRVLAEVEGKIALLPS